MKLTLGPSLNHMSIQVEFPGFLFNRIDLGCIESMTRPYPRRREGGHGA